LIAPELLPKHVALVMDGNGRWANERGLPRIEGHKEGERRLFEMVAGAVELGIQNVSAYAFSTENWRRSPEEVRFLLGFSRDTIRARRDAFDSWGVRIRWAGRRPRLWGSVIKELEVAEAQTAKNARCTLTMCINYGGRAELADATAAIARKVAAGKLNPARITEQTIQNHLYVPELPDIDLFLRSSGEQRISNFMLWQSAYAEFMFIPKLWPDVDRRDLWAACAAFAKRNRRFGGAIEAVAG
jgi:undecaprenyl diphosphate synthase